MDTVKLKQHISRVLQDDGRLWNKEKTELNQPLLLDLVEQIDAKVISLLLKENDLREKFFINVDNAYVFNTPAFRFFMEENKVDNSYTAYKNRIGLSDGKKLLKDTNDVVLDWPYKDCLLEGGQSTEEGTDNYFEHSKKTGTYEEKQAQRKEIFFNQMLAHDEIDRLLDPKALVHWKRYSKDGEQKVREIQRDENDTVKENLIIKGNNLLALHSLKKQFAGKVKLIYIDPPYNTGKDGFKYNDNFNHSTWLTFMKNRLEVARKLLRDDGVIFVQCDDNEQAYLKVLMDEVFGRENFVSNVAVRMSTSAGLKMNHKKKRLLKIKESILIYAQNTNFELSSLEELYVDKPYYEVERSDKYIVNFEDNYSNWNFVSVNDAFKKYAKKDEPKFKFVNRNAHRIFNHVMNDSTKKNWKRLSIEEKKKYKDRVRLYNNKKSEYQYAYNDHVFIPYNPKTLEGDMWNQNFSIGGTKTHEGGAIFNQGKKREVLLKRVINISTNPNDIILDYHLGSGTTVAVAHKMGRQYIGIEQMDYIETVAVERMKKVIAGEQGGISKSENWQGGGSFIYFELAKWNETAKEKINVCTNLEELVSFFTEMSEKYFLNYNLKIKEFKEKVTQEEEFRNLPLNEQKRIFLTMLDLNQMYVNKTEMADKTFEIAQEDQNLSRKFYGDEE